MSLKSQLIKGTLWSVVGQFSTLILTLITNIWLARLLSPKEFGQVGIIMFFIVLSNVFTESGLGGALIRKKDATKIDYSTVFIVNLFISIVCYILLVLCSGYISSFYDDVLLKKLLIVLGIVLIINAFQLTQSTRLVSELKFKQKNIYLFISVIFSSTIGIFLAYKGFGVWSLVIMQIIKSSIYTILLWLFEGFYFKPKFSLKSFKSLYAFGINTTLASLLNTAFDNIYQLVLSKYFSLSQTGYFYQAKKLQDVPGGIVQSISQSVIYSSLAKVQDDKLLFIKVYNKITSYFLVVLGFVSIFIFAYSKPLVLILYGEKWLGVVFYMQLLTIASFFYMQENVNRLIFKVFNKTRQILHMEYVKKIIQSITIIIGIYFKSLEILIYGFIITNLIGYIINYYFSRKIINSFNFHELITVFKVVLISALIILLIFTSSIFLKLEEVNIFYTLPFIVVLYLLGIQCFNILDLKNEFNNALIFLKHDRKNN